MAFLRAIERQTRVPDLFVLTVEESTDHTARFAEYVRALTTLNMKVIHTKGANRSLGRNIASAEAIRQDMEVLAFTNVCEPNPTWLGLLVKPIEEGSARMTGGYWFIPTLNTREAAMALLTQFSSSQMDTTKISALNMAITVEAFEHVGGFDPKLETSEDTEFVQTAHALLVKSKLTGATVKWRPSTLTVRGAVKAYHQFAITDGKARLQSDQYTLTYLAYLMFPLLPVWLLLRIRKVIAARLLRQVPLSLVVVFAMDVARMVGYARGRLGR